MARNVALQRERKAVLIDLNPSNQRDDDLLWPTKAISELKRSGNGPPHDMLRFQKDYVDIIPPTWTVISMSLSESRQALYLTKMQAGQTPFILRLPIARNNSRDVDEQVFDFGQGKAELHDIIDQANYSAHSARELSGREAKAAWWGEREALDKRLRELLENIEKVWLGGFKGIFSQQQRRPDLLSQFQKSFQNILDKHLPSRQKGSKKSKSARITLDTQILELFIGLGDGCGDGCDLDEALTDLLYFVVDVFQFHGERNAYDEIDFDSIVIETQDALRYYHEAALAASSSNEDKHTILILDKALHAFPWESLPCMDGLPVSRLPSLGCLRERLLDQRRPSSSSPEGHYVDRENGAYILNPGGDLKTTQTTFENDLQSLGAWTGITKSQPSEAEVKESLKTKDLYLYFGHGSGSQYIRAKTIKSLEKCAVTILMGCSSGALNDAGDFQPYGPPIDYMLAGCPSLVATLWDVTDKDIDRFAKTMLERWGLFNPQELGNGQATDGRGKRMRKAQESLVSEEVSLVEAVTKARKACNFRYLTAASVCVYGIPVYFK
jgi:separase